MASETENDWVCSDVYHLRCPELTYQELDKYERCAPVDPSPHEYRRIKLPVLLDSGTWIEASIYVYAGDTTGKQRITSGDYLAVQ